MALIKGVARNRGFSVDLFTYHKERNFTPLSSFLSLIYLDIFDFVETLVKK